MLRFPLGGMEKPQVRALAAEMGLAVAEKPDSQDICFVPSGRYSDVVTRLRPDAAIPGKIVHLDGRVLGQHEGIIHYTIGQRRGLGTTDNSGEPLYVMQLDATKQEVIVGPLSALGQNRVHLRDVNWLIPPPHPMASLCASISRCARPSPRPCPHHSPARWRRSGDVGRAPDGYRPWPSRCVLRWRPPVGRRMDHRHRSSKRPCGIANPLSVRPAIKIPTQPHQKQRIAV